MNDAYILIQTEVGKSSIVTKAVNGIDGVVAVDAVTGPYDVIVRASAKTLDALSRGVLSKIQVRQRIVVDNGFGEGDFETATGDRARDDDRGGRLGTTAGRQQQGCGGANPGPRHSPSPVTTRGAPRRRIGARQEE